MGTQSVMEYHDEDPKPRAVALLGLGRAGRDVAHLLLDAGLPLSLLWNRSPVPPVLDQPVIHGALPPTIDAPIVILAVADRALEELANSLAGRLATDAIVLHLSGVHPASILRGAGQPCGSMHPLQTLVGDGRPFRPFPWILEGDESALRAGHRLGRALGCDTAELSSSDKVRYHMAACSASNLLIALVDLCQRQLSTAGIADAQLPGLFLPLMSATLAHVAQEGTVASLTGPVSRGDADTVRAHTQILADNPDDQEAYRALSRVLVGVASDQGLDPQLAQVLRTLLAPACPTHNHD